MPLEPQGLIERLTEIGFWSTGDEGIPGIGDRSFELLLERVKARLGKNVRVFVNGPGIGQLYYEARLICEGEKHSLATALTPGEVICKTALALPEFLNEHPECACE